MKSPCSLVAAAAVITSLAGPALADPDPALAGYELQLGGMRFDPLVETPPVPAGWESAHAGPALRLVQLAGPTRDPVLDDLEAAGLAVIQYVHPYTYVVWSDAPQLEAARGVGAVRWAGEFHPAYKVLPRWRDLPDEPLDVKVLLVRAADTDALVRAIADLGGRSTGRRVINRSFEVAGFMVPGARFLEIARLPGVYSIQPTPTDGGLRGEMSDQACAGNYDADHLCFPGYAGWLAAVGVTGDGAIIANVDGGVQETHADLAARFLPCFGQTCGGGASSSHGTHTAGIMAADGSSEVLDGWGFLRGLGVAPGANLVEQVYSPWFGQPGGMLLLMKESYQNGAFLSGNSWGPSGSPLGYDNDTLQVDVGSRDTDPDTPGDQPLLYVLSIMNGNGGTSSQGTPDEAKNIFTIGSTWMQNSNGSQMPNINDVSSNSAHGPCLDGRTIPHAVAPGCEVDSTIPGGHGVSGWCGTSMASPHVSGAVALFLESWRSRPDYTADPSPALVKAAFLPVALDLAGNRDADNGILGHPFDNKQGWGRLHLPPVIDPEPGSVRYFDNPVVLDETGQEWSVVLSPLDPAQPMKIMLAWTDAPGHGLGGSTPAWNNDLDLVVEAGGVYYGNTFGPDGWSVTGGAPDFRNNTEGVFLGPVPPGAVTVRVVAANISSDGLPNSGDATDQDFALVAYNAAEEPGFAVTATPASQDVCAPADAAWDVEVAQILDYAEPVTLAAAGIPAGASVSFADNPVIPPAATVMTVTGTGGADWGDYEIDVTGTSVDMTRGTVVGLGLYDTVPAAPGLVAPPDGADEVSVLPLLEWTAVPQAALYDLEIALDPGFLEVVYGVTVDAPSHEVESALDPDTLHHWRVRASNACGTGDWAAAAFTTQDVPPLLLVDDDDNSPDVMAYYAEALSALGVWYDVWDTGNSDDEPAAGDLAPYSAVLWFTGDEFGGSSGPGSAGEAALGEWLDGGGCLLVSSQDYYYDRGLTAFMQAYLGVGTVASDVGQSSVTGAGTVFGGMGPYGLAYPFSNWSDRVTPRAGATWVAFTGNAGDAAVFVEGVAFRTTFWGFPLEAVPGVDDRADLLLAWLDWCAGIAGGGCPADLDGDGTVGILDFLQLLAAWGPCPGCPEDLDGDDAVGILDFLELLAAWGACPP